MISEGLTLEETAIMAVAFYIPTTIHKSSHCFACSPELDIVGKKSVHLNFFYKGKSLS